MHEAVTALSACDSHFSTRSFNSGLVQKVMKLKESPLARHSIASLPHWNTRFKSVLNVLTSVFYSVRTALRQRLCAFLQDCLYLWVTSSVCQPLGGLRRTCES